MNTPACFLGTYLTGANYVFDGSTTAGKQTLSLALTAYAAGKEVHIVGENSCNLVSDKEDLSVIKLQ